MVICQWTRSPTLFAVVAFCTLVAVAQSCYARSFVDSAGRSVTVADRIERVFAAGPAGVQWLLTILYPRYAEPDLRAATREFYELFCQLPLDDAALDGLLGTSS